jgi:hypothetical protein
VLVLAFCATTSFAQQNAEENDFKFRKRKFHFGIIMGVNIADFKIRYSNDFVNNDTIFGITSKSSIGFDLGILTSLHINKNLELRYCPGVSFQERNLSYSLGPDMPTVEKKIESIYWQTPINLKLKSDPIKDFKLYCFAGARFGFDLSANSKARRAEGLVKLNRKDFAVDYGVGVELHFPLFILSPEFKVSNTFMNIHFKDDNLIYSRTIQNLYPRTFMFSLIFEG